MADYSEYKFRIGKPFRQKKSADVLEYLEAAEETHKFLEQFKTETGEGVYWKKPEQLNLDLGCYMGSAGVAYLYLELYKVTKKELYKELALKGADYLQKHWQDQKTVVETILAGFSGAEYSLYVGFAGIGMALTQIYKEWKRQEDLDAIKAIADEILQGTKDDEPGIYWSIDKSMLLDGGVTVFLYHIYDLTGDTKYLKVASQATDNILSKAIEDERGGYAWRSYAHPGVTRVPNFECGTAGIGYVLTVAYQHTNNQKYLDAAIEAAKHLRVIAIPQGEGFLVPWHDEANEEPIFYVSSCHGPAGTSKLFYQLYKITDDKSYLEDIKGYYKGLRHLGVPEKQSVGYWNTLCLCCGTAGVLQFLLNYSMIFDDEEAKQVAITAGNILLGEKERQANGCGIAWPLAFTRVEPDVITTDIGYGVGTAGVAGALLQLYLFLEDKYKWDRLFDDPYPEAQ